MRKIGETCSITSFPSLFTIIVFYLVVIDVIVKWLCADSIVLCYTRCHLNMHIVYVEEPLKQSPTIMVSLKQYFKIWYFLLLNSDYGPALKFTSSTFRFYVDFCWNGGSQRM